MTARRSLPLLALLAAGLSACGLGGGGIPSTLSFAQMQSLNAGVSADWVLEEYPFAGRVARWPDGKVRSLTLPVTDPRGKRQTVVLSFDPQGRLVQKQYSGPILKPPVDPGTR